MELAHPSMQQPIMRDRRSVLSVSCIAPGTTMPLITAGVSTETTLLSFVMRTTVTCAGISLSIAEPMQKEDMQIS